MLLRDLALARQQKEEMDTYVYFENLKPATKYRVTLQGLRRQYETVVASKDFFSRLPKPQNISQWGVTFEGVNVTWDPVKNADKYKIFAIPAIEKEEKTHSKETTNTEVTFNELALATQYIFEIFAITDDCDCNSLPGTIDVYTKLKSPTLLNIDRDYTTDTSFLARWRKAPAATWYDVTLEPDHPGIIGTGIVYETFTHLKNLMPGTLYKISVVTTDQMDHPTGSAPVSIFQTTKLMRPQNVVTSYQDVMHDSMTVSWTGNNATDVYYVYAYDCSKRGSLVDHNAPRSTIEPTTMPAKYKSAIGSWKYLKLNDKPKKTKLQCYETVFVDVQQALREANVTLPSTVEGQGKVYGTQVTLTNLYPATQYEVVVVAGEGSLQSDATLHLQYTKLPDIQNFTFDPTSVSQSAIRLSWQPVEGLEHYFLQTTKTYNVNPKRMFARKAKKVTEIENKLEIAASVTEKMIHELEASMNYTFRLIAKNNHTESFPALINTFTRLQAPTSMSTEETTNTISCEWAPVNKVQYYSFRYAMSTFEMKDEDKEWITLSVIEKRVLLTNLTPNTKYELEVRAVNVFTESNPNAFTRHTKLPTPEDVEITDISDNKISLQWSPVPGCDSYQLQVSTSPEEPTLFKKSTKTTKFTFPGLKENQAYYIFIRASNLYTKSDVYDLFRYTKLPEPQSLLINEVRDKSMRVRWRAVKDAKLYLITTIALHNESLQGENPESITERITSEMSMNDADVDKREKRETNEYGLSSRSRRSVGSSQDSQIQSITYKVTGTMGLTTVFLNQHGAYQFNTTSTDIMFGKLDPGVKYVVVIKAWNEFTDSLPVKDETFTKLERPAQLGVTEQSINNESMLLQWIQVGKATYYRVNVASEKTAYMRDSDVRMIEAITIDSEIRIVDLLPNVKYTIEVRAGNSHIESYPSVIQQITKLSPVENLEVVESSVTYDSLEIRWNAVLHATRYTIVISPPLRNRRDRISVSGTRYILNPLKDTTNYKITVSAENARTTGVVRHVTQFTKLLSPANYTIVEESVNSSHFQITWLPVKRADEYHVQLFDEENSNITLIKPQSTMVDLNDLKSGHNYSVSLMAHNLEYGTFSDEITLWTFTKLQTPKNFEVVNASMTDTSLEFVWDAVDLAKHYKVIYVIKPRDTDDNMIYHHIHEKMDFVYGTSINIEHLRPASNYYVVMKAQNKDTESDSVTLTVFTKLTEPANLTLIEHFYMDTEADFIWFKVDRADSYVMKVFEDSDISDDDFKEALPVYNRSGFKAPAHTALHLKPETTYVAEVSAENADTWSDPTSIEFTTKSSCKDDFYHFPSTQLFQALPIYEKQNLTLHECKDLCCTIRSFNCRSISMHRETSDCALFAEDRNTAPPLGLSKYYDHYERKFWKEVSGFQIRSLSHNNVAIVNKTVEIVLTFVYVGKTGCIDWDLGEGTRHFHQILDTDCSQLCENAPPGTNCTMSIVNPIENSNQVKTSHAYDINSVYTVRVNVSDQGVHETSELKIAINERGCIFPLISIEEDAKNILFPKELFKSSKLVLSTTPTILCNSFPQVRFEWTAVVFEVNTGTVTSSFKLDSFGSEILIPPLKFDLGMHMLTSSIELVDEEHDLKHSDSVYISVIPSPLIAQIKGGNMRTVGYERIVTWDASSNSYDPDTLGPDRHDLKFMWFCRNYTDQKAAPLKSGTCFPDLNALTFDGPGIFHLDTSIMHLYVEYDFEVVVSKGDRTAMFKQQVIVKEGNPPEFYIECKENCKRKMNPTKALALNAICINCKQERNPLYEWSLLEVIDKSSLLEEEYAEPTGLPQQGFDYVDEKRDVSEGLVEEVTEKFEELIGWEANTTTDIESPILVLKKHSLPSGRKYILRLNISMDGFDGIVHSFSDFPFITNLPPENGICSTLPAEKSCQEFRKFPKMRIDNIEPKKTYRRLSEGECKKMCCLTREFLCLSFVYTEYKKTCDLFTEDHNVLEPNMWSEEFQSVHERIFYVGGAVVDEIFFECRNWRDEGDALRASDEKGYKPAQLTYKYTALPYGNRTEPLLLYFGTVPKTPGISMALGDPDDDYVVFVVAHICDMFGECAKSNVITIKIVPPDTSDVGSTLNTLTSGRDSKLSIFSSTGNSKAAAQLVQSIASLINTDDGENATGIRNKTDTMTTIPWVETTTEADSYFIVDEYEVDAMNHSDGSLNKDMKKDLRKNVVHALSAASGGMTSIDNLKQMTSAMNSITERPEEITTESQLEASDTVFKMAKSLNDFSEEANKEDIADAAKNIIGSLGSVAKSSETDMGELKDQMLKPSEINFATLDEMDQSPDEFEYYKKITLREEKKRVRRSALKSQEVMGSTLQAIDGTADSLLDKQMSGEPAETLKSDRMEMMVQKTDPRNAGNENLVTGKGTSIKLPRAESLFGKNVTNGTDPVNLQVMAFDDNPLGFSEDAALINSPVTMLKIGGRDGASSNSTEGDNEGIGISIPNTKFNPMEDMITIHRHENDTGLSISKFEMLSLNNAILILVEPEDDRNKFEVFFKFHSKPSPEDYDFKFSLPHNIWDLTMPDDQFKIFIPETEIKMTGMVFIGIQDNLNVSLVGNQHRGKVRRRRSIGYENSTTYHMLISTPGCRRFDSDAKQWTGDGCKVSEHSTPEKTECICNKLSPTSIFSAEFFVPPNTINFATVFAKINIADNPAVFSTVITLLILYILLTIWARRTDKKDKIKWELKSLMDNRKEDKYLYQVTVFTGYGKQAGTHSNVYCVLFGENGKTKPRQLRTHEIKTPFGRSSVNHFLIRVDKCLGAMTHVHVWHDNSGKGENRGWYLDQIAVQDIQTGERFYFICDNWLAVDQDDGMVDRILPVATPENMSTVHRLFITTTSQKFTEDHLWISIFYRPTKSNFTRVQRLSCCILLLFLTMIANAMWFESGQRSGASATATLNVGPFTISPMQIWTSFCSTLMVVPIVTIVVLLFKKAKTKKQEQYDDEVKRRRERALKKIRRRRHDNAATLPNPSDIVGKDAVYTIDKDGKIEAKERTKRQDIPPPNTWPHKCVYVAWVLVTLGILLSAFFAILYSFEWGREKAERWLSNMMLSFWQSVLIVQPIKVIILSLFIAVVLKKPDEQVMNSVQDKDVDEAEKKFLDLCANDVETQIQQNEVVPPKPPSKKRLRRTRKLRAKERAMSDILWEVIVYMFYILVLLFLCHGTRDSKGYHITNTIKKTFVEPKYGLQSVTSVEYFWRFMNQTLLPNIYPVQWYNGQRKNWRERSFLVDEQSYRVGPARLRQIRVNPSVCPNYTPGQDECRSHYALYRNDELDYESGWKPLSVSSEKIENDNADDFLAKVWHYRSWKELKGMPVLGGLTAYPGGGYCAELGVNYVSGKYIMDSLYRDAWIDHRTRAVFIEFTVYNPNVNLFTSINLIAEFPPVGAAMHFTSIMTFRLYHYVGTYGTLVVIAQAVFVIHLLYAMYKSVKALITLKKKFFNDPWNIFEGVILVFDWAIVSLTGLRIVLTNNTIDDFHEDKRKYVNFQQVTAADAMMGYFLALSAFLGMLRFLKLLRFNKRIGMLSSVLKYSARQWPGFFVLAAVFFISFIHVGYVVFSPFLESYKTFISTAESMINTMVGGEGYPQLRSTYRFFGPVFYFIFSFTSLFIILNILIAIIGESHKQTNSDLEKTKNQYEIIDFMMKRFVKWSGMNRYFGRNNRKTSPAAEENSLTTNPTGDIEECADQKMDNFVEFQKRLDVYAYELETKYKKLLSFDELRTEVIAQMKTDRDEQEAKMKAFQAELKVWEKPTSSTRRSSTYRSTQLTTVMK